MRALSWDFNSHLPSVDHVESLRREEQRRRGKHLSTCKIVQIIHFTFDAQIDFG